MALPDKIRLTPRDRKHDDRGWFLKVLTGHEEFLPDRVGEVYLTKAKPGEWRANHYHPKTAEWFTVIEGQSRVVLEDVMTRERMELTLSGEDPQTLFVPAGIAHVFMNTGTIPMLLAVYAENTYDPEDTIRYELLANR
ncbi:MAG TPA: WxcM-like domain-containing protein [Cyclobacteriaceae bacterium]|nr:WxcM-like domain-containing protein [Cyclobacteriaceae bacterium]